MRSPNIKFKDAIENAAMEAGIYLRKQFESRSNLEPTSKNGTPLGMVTHHDKHAEQLIKASLRKSCPGLAFIGEEYGSDGANEARYVAYIDPIDGTTNFAHGIAQFTTLISVYDRELKRVVASVIHDPMRSNTYSSAMDGMNHYQLYYNTNKIKPVPRIPESAEILHTSTLGHCLNRGYLSEGEYALLHLVNAGLEKQHQLRLRNSGSSGYDTINMIESLMRGYPSACMARGGAAWDFLASLPFAEALGGSFAMPLDSTREVWGANTEQVATMRADKDGEKKPYYDWIIWGDKNMVEKVQSTIRMAYKEQARQTVRTK